MYNGKLQEKKLVNLSFSNHYVNNYNPGAGMNPVNTKAGMFGSGLITGVVGAGVLAAVGTLAYGIVGNKNGLKNVTALQQGGSSISGAFSNVLDMRGSISNIRKSLTSDDSEKNPNKKFIKESPWAPITKNHDNIKSIAGGVSSLIAAPSSIEGVFKNPTFNAIINNDVVKIGAVATVGAIGVFAAATYINNKIVDPAGTSGTFLERGVTSSKSAVKGSTGYIRYIPLKQYVEELKRLQKSSESDESNESDKSKDSEKEGAVETANTNNKTEEKPASTEKYVEKQISVERKVLVNRSDWGIHEKLKS